VVSLRLSYVIAEIVASPKEKKYTLKYYLDFVGQLVQKAFMSSVSRIWPVC